MQLSFTICSLIFFSCNISGERVNGSGHIETIDRHVETFDKIKVMGSIDVIIDLGETNVRVKGDDNILRYIITEQNDGWLEIKMQDKINIHTSNPMRVYVTTPDISALSVVGSGNIMMDKKYYSTNKMVLRITGSGDITCNINAPRIDAKLAGSGTLHIAGETRDVEVDIAGSGNYNGTDLKAENAAVKIAGSGDVSLFADARLEVKVMGSGSVKYRGNAIVNKKIMGSGSVLKIP